MTDSFNSLRQIEEGLLAEIEMLKERHGCLRAGLPYFDGIYGRDALIGAWQLLRRKPEIARQTLNFLARYQGKRVSYRTGEEPGKILHVFDFASSGPVHTAAKLVQRIIQGLPYYGSIDATPLFVILAGETYDATRDMELLRSLWPNIVSATDWIGLWGDADRDGLVEYARHNPFGVRNQNWKDTAVYINMRAPVASIEVQGYAYMAYLTAARLAAVLDEDARDWATRADRLRERVASLFWMKDLAFYAMALDGSKRQVKEIASNGGHLLLTGILDKDAEEATVTRLFQDDMLTEFGLRTHSSRSRFFRRSCTLGAVWPHDNWLLWKGLEKTGHRSEAAHLKLGMLRARERLGCLPEYYDVVDGKPKLIPRIWGFIGGPCLTQAWSSGALLDMLSSD